jgi:hypothetical protein
MSQRSTKLLLQVAASCEVAANQNGAGRKLAGYENLAIGGRLFSDILTWARGHREALKHAPKIGTGDPL